MHSHSRRGFLRQTLGAVWTGATLLEQGFLRAARARAQASPALPPLFDIEKVAPGVYAAIARPAVMVNCNAVIFENESDILVVDTHSKPSAAITLVSQVRRQITTKPVRFIVNTHFHWDHVFGTTALKRIAPHADVVASEATRQVLAERGAQILKASVEQAQKSLAGYREKLAAAKQAEEKAYWQRMWSETASFVNEMKAYPLELPAVTFTRDLIIKDKAHDLHLAFRGRGHTAGDIVVWSPQKKCIASGDLLQSSAPFIGDGYPLEWPRTLLYLAEFDFEHVIAGHGGVENSRELVYRMGTFIEELADVVMRGRRAGKTVEEIQAETPPQALKSLDNDYGRRMRENVVKGRVPAPGSRPEEVFAETIKGCIGNVATALERNL